MIFHHLQGNINFEGLDDYNYREERVLNNANVQSILEDTVNAWINTGKGLETLRSTGTGNQYFIYFRYIIKIKPPSLQKYLENPKVKEWNYIRKSRIKDLEILFPKL